MTQISSSTTAATNSKTLSARERRMKRKFTLSFYLCGVIVALVIIPIVVFSVFELASRTQAMEFLRQQLSETRSQIVNSTSSFDAILLNGKTTDETLSETNLGADKLLKKRNMPSGLKAI
jgi:hypothetical protein